MKTKRSGLSITVKIFNYIELRDDLKKKGHIFTTQTDTEVILHLYEELGPACLNEMNGQFAFAIWDCRKKELFLARDHVGICPLYFTFQNGRFYFASEIKAIFMDPRVHRELDVPFFIPGFCLLDDHRVADGF